MLSLEHQEEWAQRVRTALAASSIHGVRVCLTPLRSYGAFDWYSLWGIDVPRGVGLILCDGPPAQTRGGRSGVLPVLRQYLAGEYVVLLDDTSRAEERSLVEDWCSRLGLQPIEYGRRFTALRGFSAAPSPVQ